MDEIFLDLLTYLKWSFLLFQLLLFAVIIAVVRLDSVRQSLGPGPFLIVTAHPDDEVMFFLPAIVGLVGVSKVHLLCLSVGDADGLGKVREKEVERAGKLIKIEKVTCVDDERLKDGMNTQWDPKIISEIVASYVSAHKTAVILTFDQQGVSSHPNHIAVRRGVGEYLKSGETGVKGYELLTTGLVRKYLGVLDVYVSLGDDLLFINVSPFLTWRAMQSHSSQFVWYRKLFVVFSRYGYLNTLQAISDSK